MFSMVVEPVRGISKLSIPLLRSFKCANILTTEQLYATERLKNILFDAITKEYGDNFITLDQISVTTTPNIIAHIGEKTGSVDKRISKINAEVSESYAFATVDSIKRAKHVQKFQDFITSTIADETYKNGYYVGQNRVLKFIFKPSASGYSYRSHSQSPAVSIISSVLYESHPQVSPLRNLDRALLPKQKTAVALKDPAVVSAINFMALDK